MCAGPAPPQPGRPKAITGGAEPGWGVIRSRAAGSCVADPGRAPPPLPDGLRKVQCSWRCWTTCSFSGGFVVRVCPRVRPLPSQEALATRGTPTDGQGQQHARSDAGAHSCHEAAAGVSTRNCRAACDLRARKSRRNASTFLKGLFWKFSGREAGEGRFWNGGVAEREGEQGFRSACPVASRRRLICVAARLAEEWGPRPGLRTRLCAQHPALPAPARGAAGGLRAVSGGRGRPCHTQTHGHRSSPAAARPHAQSHPC